MLNNPLHTIRIFTIPFFLFLIFQSVAQAQPGLISRTDEELVRVMGEKYKGSDVLVTSSKIEFSFDYSGKNKTAQALEYREDELIALKDNVRMQKVVYYDGKSKVYGIHGRSQRKVIPLKPVHSTHIIDEIFYSDAMKCTFDVVFYSRGYRADYSYYKEYNDLKYLTSVNLFSHLPIQEMTVTFTVPSWLDLELLELNFVGHNIKKTVTQQKGGVKSYQYQRHEIPPYKSENNAPRSTANQPHILILAKGIKAVDHGQELLSSVDDLYKWYRSLRDEIGNKPEELKKLVSGLTRDLTNDKDKVRAIYYWVQDNIRYIAFEDGIMAFKPDAAQNVFQKKYGDCKGMANLLCEMLKLEGFDARLTWIGTRDVPYDYSIPSLLVDNHMICTLILGGNKYFLDATETFIPFGMNAERIQGRPVMIEDGDNYFLDKVPLTSPENNLIESVIKMHLDGNKIEGERSLLYEGEEKSNIYHGYHRVRTEKKEESMGRFLTSNNKNLIIKDVSYSSLTNRDTTLHISFRFSLDNHITNVGQELYINIDPDKELAWMKFDEKRMNDYLFDNKMKMITTTFFDIPKGYRVSHLPTSVSIEHTNLDLSLNMYEKGSMLTYSKTIIIKDTHVKKKDFPALEAAIQAANQFYNDQIILVKIN